LVVTLLALLAVVLSGGLFRDEGGAARAASAAIFARGLGSCISALVSALERISHGWEFSRGLKYPAAMPADKFVLRMAPFFVLRPFLGAVMGLVVYAGARWGQFIASTAVDST